MYSSYSITYFLIEYGIHSIRFLLVHDYMLQEVFLGVGELSKVNHPLQVTCIYNPLQFFYCTCFLPCCLIYFVYWCV